MNKIFILSSITPNESNKGGPSGLIHECNQLLLENGFDVVVSIIDNRLVLNKLGIYVNKIKVPKEFSIILVYPFNLFFSLDLQSRRRSIVLGPDSPSLLFRRFYRSDKKIKDFLLFKWFLYKENILLSDCLRFLVVGKNDSRWLKNTKSNFYNKIFYLTHPILTSLVRDLSKKKSLKFQKNLLIFSGDLSPKYSSSFFDDFSKILPFLEIDILVVGLNNYWVYKKFLEIDSLNICIEYESWIDNYSDICNPDYHIHIIPIFAGAGTKNRTLSACAAGVPIFVTFVGFENIFYNFPENKIVLFKEAFELLVHLKNYVEILKNNNISFKFVENTNDRFKLEFLSYMNLNYYDNN